MTTALANSNGAPSTAIEAAIIQGDLSSLTPDQRVTYYMKVCETLGLNPLTKPFEYLKLNNRLVLYAAKGCTDQLRKINCISVTGTTEEEKDGILTVTAQVREEKTNRTDEDKGCISLKGLSGEALANAKMKCTTKAKRRATLSICGLGWLDETEVDSIPGAQRVTADLPHEETPRPAPAPKVAPPKADTTSPPANGKDLYDRLNKFDRAGADKKYFKPGALVAAVLTHAERNGDPGEMATWSRDQINEAVEFAKKFLADAKAHHEAKNAPVPEVASA